MRAREVMTIGYEGKRVDDFLADLIRHRVERVVDVRALPLSRRRGFSKSLLSAALAEAGIEYQHVRAAGNPFRHDCGAIAEVLTRYRRHVLANPAALEEVRAAVAGARSALLCFEADAASCHRSVLATFLAAGSPDRVRVRDL